MFLFDIFRSFLPLRNPIGFGAADFVEFSIAAAFLLVALKPAFRYLAARPAWCMAFLFLAPLALRLALLPGHPIPTPAGADDFSYLLLGDTLAHLRLANPVHPMHRFFEAVFILQEPSYSSIYPVGQGIVLAWGQLFFGQPWAGVALSVALFCALSYWMLRGWTTPEWALAGGLLAVFEFGPLNQWMNLYWGGALPAAAGCLIFGALPRIRQAPARRTGILLGLGLAIALLTRPFELLFLLPIVGWTAWSAPGRRVRLPILLAFLPAIALTLFHNRQVTHSWTTLPYQLSRYQYGIPATFTFQLNPVPHRQLTPEQQLDYEAQSAIHGTTPETASTYLTRLAARIRFSRFFLVAPLYLALPFFLYRLRQPGYRWVTATLLLLALGANFYPYFYPHYIAAATCVFLLLAVTSLEQLSKSLAGARAARLILPICAAHFFFWYGAYASGSTAAARDETWYSLNAPDPQGRATIGHRLSAAPGRHLVFVHYAPNHMFHEWIHNAADIDNARIVWAGDLGQDENARLRRYYPNRTAWLVEPDARPPKLTRYE